jgi:hypothetical protein
MTTVSVGKFQSCERDDDELVTSAFGVRVVERQASRLTTNRNHQDETFRNIFRASSYLSRSNTSRMSGSPRYPEEMTPILVPPYFEHHRRESVLRDPGLFTGMDDNGGRGEAHSTFITVNA